MTSPLSRDDLFRAQHVGACAYCGGPTKLARRKTCSKRCAGLLQNEAKRASGEPEARYWSNVDRKAESECWPWLAGTVEGYGQVRFCGEKLGTHVVSFRLANGAIPAGKMVLHRCGNRRCCNPGHLYAGTHADNTNDAIRHGTYKTVFTPGHPDYRRSAA